MLGKTCQEVQGPNFYHKNIPEKGIFEDIKEVRKHIQETEAISEQTGDFSAISLYNTSFRVMINIFKKKSKNFENK